MTFDDLLEQTDEFGCPGDTPFRLNYDGEWLCVSAMVKEPDGTITLELELEVE
jgi:hypothetical protein